MPCRRWSRRSSGTTGPPRRARPSWPSCARPPRFAMPIYQPRTFVSTGYQGTLGWGFATALGVKAANPGRAVLSVTGDGGFMFTMPELATAVQHKIATVTVVFNDGAYGNVRRTQKNQYGGRVIPSAVKDPG